MNRKLSREIRAQIIRRKNKGIKERWETCLMLAPLLAVMPVADVMAQGGGAGGSAVTGLEEVIVTARRRDESIQDVPLTVNVVDSEMLEDMNVRRLEDLESLVAGLTLNDDPLAPNTAMRGVRFDAYSSGNNPTVEFYMNDAPVLSHHALQSMFDMGMIEVLRGPQGTLRGRASPSGSILLRTKRPNLESFGGDIDITQTNKGGKNIKGALNVPLVENTLALRLAGFREENRMNHAKSFWTGDRSELTNEGWRVSLRYEPVDNLQINLMHQNIETDRFEYTMVESAHLRDPDRPLSPVLIRAEDRISMARLPSAGLLDQDRTGLEVAWQISDLEFNYAGSLFKQDQNRYGPGDNTGFYSEAYPETLQNLGQRTLGDQQTENHELRMSGTVGERLNYVVGALYQSFDSINDVTSYTAVFAGGIAPHNFMRKVETPIQSYNFSREKSFFGNINYHLTDATELSVGARHIDYQVNSGTIVSGRSLGSYKGSWKEQIFNASLAHSFSDELMTYVSVGTSWRPGVFPIGNTNLVRSPLEMSFLDIPPEESVSYEVGVKSRWLDNRLTVNGTIFYQEFDNYPYRGNSVSFVSTDSAGLETIDSFNFVAPVELDTYGLEIDASFQITERWSMGGTYSWAQGFLEGDLACNDYYPRDGKPDTSTNNPPLTVEQIRNATGGDNLSACSVRMRSYSSSTWTSSLRTEYAFPIIDDIGGYVRLQATFYGDSEGSPTSSTDQISSYGIFNLYTGIRASDRKWDVMVYARNIMNTERRTGYGGNPLQTSIRVVPTGNVTVVSDYRSVSLTAPREAGLNVRYNF